MKHWKSSNGSITLLVIVTVLFFVIIAIGVYVANSNTRVSQMQEIERVKEVYEADLAKIDEIYEERVSGQEPEPDPEPEPEPDLEYIKEGLILHYDAMDNIGEGEHSSTTTTWKDLSGNGNDGKITGGKWAGSSLRFTTSNSSNGVKTNSNFPLDFQSNTFNIVFTLTSVNDVEALFGARTSTTNGFMLFNYKANNCLGMDTKGSGTRIKVGERLQANKQYNLTVTLSNGTLQYYLDGELINTTTYTQGSINFPLTIFTAGAKENSLGNIYSVKVYNRALTAEEVLQNYKVDKEKYTSSYATEGLLLHLDGENNTGNGHSSTATTWKDLSGNGNDGVLSKALTDKKFYWGENYIALANVGSSSGTYIDTPLNLNGKERTIFYTVDANNLTRKRLGRY